MQGPAGFSIWRTGLLALAILAAPIALVVETVAGKPIDALALRIAGIVTTLLVAVRVALLQHERRDVQAALGLSEQNY